MLVRCLPSPLSLSIKTLECTFVLRIFDSRNLRFCKVLAALKPRRTARAVHAARGALARPRLHESSTASQRTMALTPSTSQRNKPVHLSVSPDPLSASDIEKPLLTRKLLVVSVCSSAAGEDLFVKLQAQANL